MLWDNGRAKEQITRPVNVYHKLRECCNCRCSLLFESVSSHEQNVESLDHFAALINISCSVLKKTTVMAVATTLSVP